MRRHMATTRGLEESDGSRDRDYLKKTALLVVVSIATLIACLFPCQTNAAGTVLPAYNPQLDAVPAPTGFGTGQTWQVGPSRQYKKPSEVVNLVHDGDIVEIDAATYACEESVKWKANFLTLKGVGGRPVMDATNCSISGGKGIWTPYYTMHDMIIDSIEFMGARVGDMNGAGIRYDGGGYLYITNSYFHDNQNGVLITPNSGLNLVIDHSEFARNGAGDGYSHNMYISGGVSTFVLRFSYSHNAGIGHTVKSRALTNYILYNRIADETGGTSSYNIDIPQGGLTYIIGNVIQQSATSPNYGIIAYSAEGTHNPVQKIYISHNTIVSEGLPAASALSLYDNGLTEAKMVNNLIVGVSPAKLVSGATDKITPTNNIVTDSPAFYDQSGRVYYLTAGSPAVNAAVDPGTGNGLSLAPVYQFALPASGQIRQVVSSSADVGAFEYDPNQIIIPAPTIAFSATDTTINYNAQAQLTWSSTNAATCEASGAWSGQVAASGSYASQPLTSNTTFTLICSGSGGSALRSVSIIVNDSAAAAALGQYTWQQVTGSKINNVSAANLKDGSGNYTYADNFGTGPYTESKGYNATGVFVPETDRWYLMGGGGGRNYYGNEVYAFNFATQKAELVTEPTHIKETLEYFPSDFYGSMIHMSACNGIMHLVSGGIAPARRGVIGTAGYNPVTKKIIVGPSGIVGGVNNCNGSNSGQYATDMWSFDPLTNQWTLLAAEDDRFGSVSVGTTFIDPATGIAFYGSNRSGSTRGGYLIDYNVTPPVAALVDNVWPFMPFEGSVAAVDTVNHYALALGVTIPPSVAVYNLNGLSMSRYGTNGSTGSTGTAGGPGPLFEPDKSWTFTGDTTVLSLSDVAVTFNPFLQKFVAWAEGDVVYFLTPNYQTKVLDILAKHVYGNPATAVGAEYKFSYIPEHNVYLAFVGTDHDFYVLKPPAVPAVPTGLTVTNQGTGSGTITSNPAGINCTSGICSTVFDSDTTVVLTATPAADSIFGGWTLDCAGSGTGSCTLNMTADRNAAATFNLLPNARIGNTNYGLLSRAYAAVGDGGVIQAKAISFVENLTLNREIAFTLRGGYGDDYGGQTGYTVIDGVLTIKNGSLIVDRVVVK